jgi:hypothetical protein
MNERRVEEAARYRDVALEPVLRIEDDDVELFNREILQTLRKNLVHIAWPAHGRSFLSFFRRHAPSQFQRGVNTNSTSRSYAVHARQSSDRLRRKKAERATTG